MFPVLQAYDAVVNSLTFKQSHIRASVNNNNMNNVFLGRMMTQHVRLTDSPSFWQEHAAISIKETEPNLEKGIKTASFCY